MNGAQALFKALTDAGVTTCFANPGTSEMQLVYEIGLTANVRPILCLQEDVVTGAADGYARMKGSPAVTLLHVGSGFANGIAMLHNAGRANTPVINVVGARAPVHLSAVDRGRAAATFDQMAQSIAGYEASHEVTAFSSKYDAVQAGRAQFTPQEQRGYELFRGKAKCNDCHRDGGPGEDPLFTDFTASNIGTPANPDLPYYAEGEPDQRGYVANKGGASFVDLGVGGFIANGHPLSQPSAVDSRWKPLASQNRGRFKTPTLRNVDKRPSPDFVKAYGHNGYFKSLKEIVHFYNTRDVLPRCGPRDPREGTDCWPAPETTENMNKSKTGNLGLTGQEENALVAFIQTLTDGYAPAQK